ncbi:MAG TPA: biotin/lipoyl-containing protein [Anaeromyxobacteraceae bacterium]|nr:biotin/lipoyl-containing protein [Anaeromyxobacteraceae bacterium]
MSAARTYVALLDGGRREETVEVTQVGPGAYEVRVGGRTRRVDAFRHDYGTVSLLVDTESFSVQLDQRTAEVKVHVRDSTYGLEILDERRLRMRRAAGKFTVDGRQVLTAPMPGKVVKVLARVGDAVREGQSLLTMEAMKMEQELRSPKDGKLVELSAAEGQAVEGGARLAAVE